MSLGLTWQRSSDKTRPREPMLPHWLIFNHVSCANRSVMSILLAAVRRAVHFVVLRLEPEEHLSLLRTVAVHAGPNPAITLVVCYYDTGKALPPSEALS